MDGITAVGARVAEIRLRMASMVAPGAAPAAPVPAVPPSDFSAVLASALASTGAVDRWIEAALARTGAPASWAAGLRTIAEHESGFDPSAYNGNDRTRDGRRQSVVGLMQMLPSTFEAHAAPGEDIHDPVDNLSAAIRYIRDRYGDPSNTPGLRSLAAGGRYRGY